MGGVKEGGRGRERGGEMALEEQRVADEEGRNKGHISGRRDGGRGSPQSRKEGRKEDGDGGKD